MRVEKQRYATIDHSIAIFVSIIIVVVMQTECAGNVYNAVLFTLFLQLSVSYHGLYVSFEVITAVPIEYTGCSILKEEFELSST